jgi:hypothetical protein
MASEQSAALVQPTIKIKSVLLRFVAGFLMVGEAGRDNLRQFCAINVFPDCYA